MRFIVCVILTLGIFTPSLSDALQADDSSGMEDTSNITWAHAVNSRQALEEGLAGNIDFLEADISMGYIILSETGSPIPIMAHPPDTVSDISLENWLDIVISRRTGKGVKLDFKSLDAVEPSLMILSQHNKKITFPLWLNADILYGPVNSTTIPVSADKFLLLCNQYFPNATLSLGWTTYWSAAFPPETWHYDWSHVREMADSLRCNGLPPAEKFDHNLTFPVRGVFASRSISQLKWLLDVYPRSTLTVWSGKYDPLDVPDLMRIRKAFPKNKIYYDIPEPVDSAFRRGKDEYIETEPSPSVFFNRNWLRVSHENESFASCDSYTYVNERTVFFGKKSNSAILLKEPFAVTDDKPLKIQGFLTFLGDEHVSESQQLILSLTSVNSFSENSIPESSDVHTTEHDGTDIIWRALNSSRLHVFEHNDSPNTTSCYFFKLDTSMKNSFQVWSFPCYILFEDTRHEEIEKIGKNEILGKKRLVLPQEPMVFGMISLGNQTVVVYDLKIEGEKAYTSSTSGYSKQEIGQFVMLACAVFLISIIFS